MVVDIDPDCTSSLVAALDDAGFETRVAASAGRALQIVDADPKRIDVVLGEIRLPGEVDGFELLERLRERDAALCTVLMTAHDDYAAVRRALSVGARDYVAKSGDWVGEAVGAARRAVEATRAAREREALLERARESVARLQALNDELEILASTDALTGVYNRRHVDLTLDAQMSLRDGSPFAVSVLLLDIDHFKRVNDRHGHEIGDEVLRRVALTLLSTLRPRDLVGRYGGEEFLIVLVGAAPSAAVVVAERALGALGAIEIEGTALTVGASIGVAGIEEGAPGVDAHDLVRGADAAMYRAKEGGRNRVVLGAPVPRPATY